MTDSHPTELIANVADRLGRIEGVAAVALGGSWARREAYPDSDIDLGIYYRPDNPPPIEGLRLLAEELDDRHPPDAVTGLGEWGPWINGGGWLLVGGQRMDWLYRDLGRMEEVFAECRDGRPTCHYQPGHPHGFHNHMYMGEVHHGLPLIDPGGGLAALKQQTAEYPQPLKLALIKKYLWEAQFALDTSCKPAGRGEVYYVSGCAFRCVACLVQVLFALNERYFVNEKGSVKAINAFPSRPTEFEEVVEDVLSKIGDGPSRLERSVERLGMMVDEVRTLCSEGLPSR
jgi:predicted nucleotidyltransferase